MLYPLRCQATPQVPDPAQHNQERAKMFDWWGVLILSHPILIRFWMPRKPRSGFRWMPGRLPTTTGRFLRGAETWEQGTACLKVVEALTICHRAFMEEMFERVIFAASSARIVMPIKSVSKMCIFFSKVEEDLLFSPDFFAFFRSAPSPDGGESFLCLKVNGCHRAMCLWCRYSWIARPGNGNGLLRDRRRVFLMLPCVLRRWPIASNNK